QASALPKIELVALESLKPDAANPRTVDAAQLDAICRSIVEFGVVDPLIARREDGLIIGGHQRPKALLHLTSGGYRVKGKPVSYSLPDGKVPVVFVDGFSDQRAKLLNLALNKIGGDWEHEALARLFRELSVLMPTEELTLTGFSTAE